MTITEQSTTPQDEPQRSQGLEALVQTLAKQAFAEHAKELSERAKAAEEHSRLLAERVALLEDKDCKPETGEDASPSLANDCADAESARISFVERGEGLSKNIIGTHSNHDVDGDENEDALSDRALLHEWRGLDSQGEDKGNRSIDNKYPLPESTFSLLITEPPCSIPFAYAVFSIALSITCLCLTLASSVAKGTKENRLGVPGGVTNLVIAAQFLGVLVGVLMEDEIPQGLQFIANGVGNRLLLNGRKVQMKVITSSIVRLIVGYLFLSSLFINIVQNSDVIEIFYDVLALEFVENIDDTAFALAKRGFFGRHLLLATVKKHTLELSGRRQSLLMENRHSMNENRSSYAGLIVSNNRTNFFVRFVYFLNVAIVLAGLSYITVSQENGKYRCNTITVTFDEEIWEHARVLLPDGNIEERLLIYSYFNGKYREVGLHNGYPKYIEQNKNDGTQFQSTVGAEIKYCSEIKSWVFMHPYILTSPNGEEENECSWLWRSSQTDDFDLISTTASAWDAWVGEVKPLAQVSMICNECTERSDCNYHGSCEERKCVCDGLHFGDSCEFELPCRSLASEKAQQIDPEKGMLEWEQENPIRQIEGHRVYNRPVYIQKGLSGEPYDMRLYKILEPDSTPMPSSQPSDLPSVSKVPTSIPSQLPSDAPSSLPTPMPSLSPTKTLSPTSTSNPTITSYDTDRSYTSGKSGKAGGGGGYGYGPKSGKSTSKSAKPYTPNKYDTAPDFADWDDFFESKPLHDLEDIMDDYSVILSYSGSRFYGTIIEPNATFDYLFPPDYHAFWSQSFNVNRTFIISDTTITSTPVGIDFFEMRRRINTLLNPNVQFSYSPFGALIPLMSYEGAGFFHCLEETPQPSISPSSSRLPTSSPHECTTVVVNIFTDNFPDEVSWTIFRVATSNAMEEESLFIERSEEYLLKDSLQSRKVCLQEGEYKFTIKDSDGDGIIPGHYNITSYGELIAQGGDFGRIETTGFSMPWTPAPSASPSSSSSPTDKCWNTSVNLMFDSWPQDISWTIYTTAAANRTQGEKLFIKKSEEYEHGDALSLQSSHMCLQEGEYQFTILDSYGDGIRPPGYYKLVSNGEVIFHGGWFRKSKTYLFSIPVLPKPSSSPSTSQSPSSSLSPSTDCTDTPGYIDMYGDGCEYYETDDGQSSGCLDDGNDGDAGMTPNENCCVCKGLSKATALQTTPEPSSTAITTSQPSDPSSE
mmetsp:Transcript_37653/g.69184  ORF Transcript_37653/g.69184 Transcript_37653/m.69184 type:complete len:1210 (+) Transcript_37653:238-3867(+)